MTLSGDLLAMVGRLADRSNVCNLVSVRDLADALPVCALRDGEARALMAALADHGLDLIEPNAADLLTNLLSGRRQA